MKIVFSVCVGNHSSWSYVAIGENLEDKKDKVDTMCMYLRPAEQNWLSLETA